MKQVTLRVTPKSPYGPATPRGGRCENRATAVTAALAGRWTTHGPHSRGAMARGIGTRGGGQAAAPTPLRGARVHYDCGFIIAKSLKSSMRQFLTRPPGPLLLELKSADLALTDMLAMATRFTPTSLRTGLVSLNEFILTLQPVCIQFASALV